MTRRPMVIILNLCIVGTLTLRADAQLSCLSMKSESIEISSRRDFLR